MTDQELERRLAQALDHTAPDDCEGVLSRCEARKGTVIPMTNKQTKNRWRPLIAACLALALVGGGGGLFYQQSYAVASVVSLDVNPSIELKVNQKEKVLACTPLNQEAREALTDMGGGADLEGTKLDVAVNAIVGALVRRGYLDSISSAILISVEDKDEARAAKLRQELTAAVDSVLQEQSNNASVLSQTLTQDAALEAQARENNISTGKAYLVRQVMEMNGTIAANSTTAQERLSALSVEELSDLLETGEPRIPIGKSAAAQAAEQYAGTLSVDSVTVEVDPELDEVPAYYEVELHHPTLGEFEYRVDAFTGAVLSGRADILSGGKTQTGTQTQSGNQTQTGNQSAMVGEAKAKTAALAHAGVSESAVKYCNVWLEYDDGRPECYEVEFEVNGVRYKYEIGLYDATVQKSEVERKASTASGEDIGQEKAKAAALSHAGLTESQVTKWKVERDEDHGRLEYEVEFKSGGVEYEYTIDGATGAVLEHESERED